MTKKPEKKQERGVPSNEASTMSLMISMADTTWRMFTPPALLVPAGIWADLQVGSKPWITLLASVLGLTLSILLVKRQLRESL
jgi:hypothetical protein